MNAVNTEGNDILSNQSDGAKPAIGFGPNRGGDFSQEDYHHPAAGWGAAISVSKVLITQGELIDGTSDVRYRDAWAMAQADSFAPVG